MGLDSRSVFPAAALVLLLGCDDRCSLSSCRTLYLDCGATLKAEPNYERCGLSRADGRYSEADDREDDRTFRCAEACVASNAGEALECLSDQGRACRDGQAASVLNRCDQQRPQPRPDCTPKCDEARVACEAKCPVVSMTNRSTGECLDCVARCGLAWGRCDAACRGDE